MMIRSTAMSLLFDSRVEDWFDVNDRGAVECFEELIAAGAVKPGEHDDALADAQVADGFGHVVAEHQPGRRGPFTLPWCLRRFGQGRCDPWLSCLPPHLPQAPATCLVGMLSRLKTLVVAIDSSSAASPSLDFLAAAVPE